MSLPGYKDWEPTRCQQQAYAAWFVHGPQLMSVRMRLVFLAQPRHCKDSQQQTCSECQEWHCEDNHTAHWYQRRHR